MEISYITATTSIPRATLLSIHILVSTGEIMGIRKTDVEHEDIEKHKPLTGAEKAEVKRYEESKEKHEIVSDYRTKIDKRK